MADVDAGLPDGPGGATIHVDDAVLAAAAALAGADVELVGPTSRGESRSTFLLRSPRGELILKVIPGRPGVLDDQHRLVRLVERLRRSGYPAPEHLGAACAGAGVVTLQRRMPGDTLEPGPGRRPYPKVFGRLLPALLAAVELQREAGDLASPPWPASLLATIERGGDGYCLHETMRRRADTAAVLDRLQRLTTRSLEGAEPARTSDVVHFDLNPANILHLDGRLTGIVDWNVPFAGAAQGDRGFDVATLLFYGYDVAELRERLWEAAVRISGEHWTVVHLCHLVLRQLEWSVRHRPGSAEESRFRDIALRVLDDCERR